MEIHNKKIIHDDFIKLVGKRVIKTWSDRGGVAIGNKDFVMLIGSGLDGNTFVGGLQGKGFPEYVSLVHECGLKYYSTLYVYANAYIFSEDVEPFPISTGSRLVAGTYTVYIGYGAENNYLLLVKRF